MTDVQRLKEKYFKGETSLQEEQELRRYIETHPEDQMAPLFSYFAAERKVEMSAPLKKPATRMISIRMLMSIAASVVMLVAAVYTFQRPVVDQKGTVEDPEVAMQVTLEALSLIGGKINKSEKVVRESVSQLDKTYIQRIL